MSSTNKYDRQLRLWGALGQKALSEARICVLGSGALAAEALKNLVLPGVGHVTLVDDARVTAADVANNFFVPLGSEGASLAQVRARVARARAQCRRAVPAPVPASRSLRAPPHARRRRSRASWS